MKLLSGIINSSKNCAKCYKYIINNIYGVIIYCSQDDDWEKDINNYCWDCFKKYNIMTPSSYIITEEFGKYMSRDKILKILKLDKDKLLFNWWM